MQFGIEIDVAAFEERVDSEFVLNQWSNWSPPPPNHSTAFAIEEDVVEVRVYASEGGPKLVAAIELLSPANKDRPESQFAFVSKCESFLHRGIGLVMVDIVTSRCENMHGQLMRRLGDDDGAPVESALCVTAYRPMPQSGPSRLDVWTMPLELGDPLPQTPLWLRGGIMVPLRLEDSYHQACVDHRIV